MLAELGEELRRRGVRFMLVHVMTLMRQMLELAGTMKAIQPQDMSIGLTPAVVDDLSTQHDEASHQALMDSGAHRKPMDWKPQAAA
ncbi:MAG TPA: hypothetical protein VK449_12705 [Anaerolineales bacterium]|nr:hypothetical protein [Anaerolineales bacterium]